jgi:hypothetical protein
MLESAPRKETLHPTPYTLHPKIYISNAREYTKKIKKLGLSKAKPQGI